MLWSGPAKRLYYEWNRLYLRDGIMYRRFEDPEGIQDHWQLIVPYQYRREVIERAHGGMTGGHMGVKKTQDQVSRRMYWPTWKSDVIHCLKRCAPCAQYHRGKEPRQAFLNPVQASEAWEVISMDITGPHPISQKGNQYIMTVMDLFTKYAEAFPIRKHTAPIVAEKLGEVFARHGTPLQSSQVKSI